MAQIPDVVLNLAATCPLRTERPVSDRLFVTASHTLRWALCRKFEGRVPTPAEARDRFVMVWKSLYYPEYKDVPAPPDHKTFWIGAREGRTIGKRIRDFVLRYEVLVPLGPYSLTVQSDTIEGEYALLQRKDGSPVQVLNVVSGAPSYRNLPDLASCAKWLHARRNSEAKSIEVLNFTPILWTKPWALRFENERLAIAMIESILKVINGGSKFPNPGVHCSSCVEKDCLEVFNVRPNDHRRV